MTIEKKIRLLDGRELAYREYGAPVGAPVFFFHGWPGSRLDFELNQQTSAAPLVVVLERT